MSMLKMGKKATNQENAIHAIVKFTNNSYMNFKKLNREF